MASGGTQTVEEMRRRLIAGELEQARALANAALQQAFADQDAVKLAEVLDLIGDIAARQNETAEARRAYLAAHDAYLSIGSEVGLANVALSLGNLCQGEGDLAAARAHLEHALAGYARAGRKRGQGQAHLSLGIVARMDGRMVDAGQHLDAALRLFEETPGSQLELANARFQSAMVALKRGDERATGALEAALRDYLAIGDPLGAGNACHALAQQAMWHHDLDSGERHLDDAQLFFERAQTQRGIIEARATRAELLRLAEEALGTPELEALVARTRRVLNEGPGPAARRRLLEAAFGGIMQAYAQVGPRAKDEILVVCVADTANDPRALAAVKAIYGAETGVHVFVRTPRELVEACGGLPADNLMELERARAGVLNIVVLAQGGVLCKATFMNPLNDDVILVPMGSRPPQLPQA